MLVIIADNSLGFHDELNIVLSTCHALLPNLVKLPLEIH